MRFVVGFLLGILVGASIGLVLAPQPGSQTRSIVVERVKQRARRNGEPPFETMGD
jgi:gas vesicle protein